MYGSIAPIQVLELPVSTRRLSKSLAHLEDHISWKVDSRLTVGGWDTDADFGYVKQTSIVQLDIDGLPCRLY